MAVTGNVGPWKDNYPVVRQLWNPGPRTPGAELQLVPTNRNLTVQFRDADGDIVLASSEVQSTPYIKVLDATKGLVEIRLYGDAWQFLQPNTSYDCEVIAYGALYDEFEFSTKLPEAGETIINGIEVYGAPRQILELISQIPGANVQIAVPLNGGWSKNAQGYWTKTIPATQPLFGFWFNDHHAKQVEYEDLATSGERAIARVATSADTHTLYYKGTAKEKLDSTSFEAYCETAHNRYVLRCLQEATAEVERYTSQSFNKRRVLREVHDGLYRNRQLVTRKRPVIVDEFFRLDCFAYAREIRRRYREEDVSAREDETGRPVFVDSFTGTITLNQTLYDLGNEPYLSETGLGLFLSYPTGKNNIECSYTCGYDTLPVDVDEAASNFAAIRQLIYWERAISQGMQSMSIGCVNMSFADGKKYMDMWQQAGERQLTNYQHLDVEPI